MEGAEGLIGGIDGCSNIADHPTMFSIMSAKQAMMPIASRQNAHLLSHVFQRDGPL